MENPDMFWTIFGAVGTTFGTLVTAVAVIIAIHQYRQPLKKGLKIRFSSGFTVLNNGMTDSDLFIISVSNTCVRNIKVTGIYINVGNKDIVDFNGNMQFPFQRIDFPIMTEPEDNIEYRLMRSKVINAIRDGISRKELNPHDNVRIHVRDSSDKNYFKNLRWKATDFLK